MAPPAPLDPLRDRPAPAAAPARGSASAPASAATGAPTVVLASAWHDDNKGDSAIAEGVMELVAEVEPGVRFVVASMLDARHPGFATAYRHLKRARPDLQVVGSPVAKPEPERRASGLVRWFFGATSALVALALGARGGDLARRILDGRLVIANGGHTLYAQRGPSSWIRLVRILYPYWLARRFGRPYAVFGQSLGPFDDPLGRRWVAGVLRHAERVCVREALSLDVARGLGVPEARLALVPDPAFALTPSPTPAVRAVQERHGLRAGAYWVVTVRQAYGRAGRAESTAAFVAEMARFIERALSAGRVERVAIVAHTLGPVPSEDDRIPARALHAAVASDRAVLIEDDLAPRELAALYGDAAWVVGTRFHSVILALVAGTPTLAVSYFGPKTHGIMRMLGMEALCLDLATFDADEALARIERQDVGALTANAAAAVERFRGELRAAMADLLGDRAAMADLLGDRAAMADLAERRDAP